MKIFCKTKISNLELIAMNLTAEFMEVHSECQLFRAFRTRFETG
jgi:hypothetical protein